MTDANSNPITPQRGADESGAGFRARSRSDYKFDPGIQFSPTDFSQALKPRLGALMKPRGITPATPEMDAQKASGIVAKGMAINPMAPAQGIASSLAQSIASLPSVMPAPLFASVTDSGAAPATNPAVPPRGGLMATAAGTQFQTATGAGGTARSLASRYGTGSSFTPSTQFASRLGTNNFGTVAQNNGLSY